MSKKNKVITLVCAVFAVGMVFTVYKMVTAKSGNDQSASKTAAQQAPSQNLQNSPDENTINDNNAPADNTANNSVLGDSSPAPSQPSGQSSVHGFTRNLPAGSKPFFGQITSMSGSQMTLSGRNNTAVTVVISDSTSFTGGTKDNLASGARIAGYGTANSDGSITAQSITINPTMPSGSGGRFNRNGGVANPDPNQQQ